MAPEQLGTSDWVALEESYSPDLVRAVRERLDRADSLLIDPTLLGPSFRSDVETTTRLLEEVARLGYLATEEVRLCGNCGVLASSEDQVVGTCPKCGSRYEELDRPFKVKRLFKRPAGRGSRDISWMVTAHGMNTDGPWQQDFSWLIANKLKYSAPVLILKYPVFRIMALFERTQRLLVADLGARLEAAREYAGQRGNELTQTPDVVLHSYGTLLFSRLLLDARFRGLRFGRVILAGSIVTPDYDWAQHVKSGRVEQVVNHCGDRDAVVGFAQYFIPGSGPSGRRGFIDKTVYNVSAAGFGHGTFFEPEQMKANLTPGGVWDRFLTYPTDSLAGSDMVMAGPDEWHPGRLAIFVRLALKLLAIVGLGPLIWFAMQLLSALRALAQAR